MSKCFFKDIIVAPDKVFFFQPKLLIFTPPTSENLEGDSASGSFICALRFLMHSITSEPCMLGF